MEQQVDLEQADQRAVPRDVAEAEVEESSMKALLTDLRPNNWNANRLRADTYASLKSGLQELLAVGGELPPIVVRRDPTGDVVWEIIDGEHRWKALGELGETEVSIHDVGPVDDTHARWLTSVLNYLRGTPDDAVYAELLASIGAEWSLEDMASRMVETEQDLQAVIAMQSDNVSELLEALTQRPEEKPMKDATQNGSPVSLKFELTSDMVDVVNRAIEKGAVEAGSEHRGRILYLICAGYLAGA